MGRLISGFHSNTITNMEDKTKKVEMEKCVLCGKETIYPKDLNVELRDYYVEGAGQLCMDCYFDLYEKRERHH